MASITAIVINRESITERPDVYRVTAYCGTWPRLIPLGLNNVYALINPDVTMRFSFLKGILLPQNRKGIIRDVMAGFSLGSMNIPQLMGYARIAGMPVVTGLYTALLPVVAFAILGSSRHLVVAADSATATILASSLNGMAPLASEKYVELVGMVALLTAGFLLLARVFRLGFLADFLSRTVLVGFLTGVGVQVGIAMLGDMFGLVITSPHTTEQLWQIVGSLSQIQGLSLEISVVVVGFILICKHYLPKLPAPLFAVAGGIATSYFYNFSGHGIAVIGKVPGGLPPLSLPHASWHETLDLIPIAVSCFVMIIAQSAAASRVFAERYHESVDENADILGLCVANAVAAVSSAFVVNGSPTQTAMAEMAGARSQLAQLTFAFVVLVFLLLLTGLISYLPHCVLAGIVFTIAIGLVDVKSLRDIRRESPGEFSLALITATAVPVLGVGHGLLLAIALSVLRHVRHSYHPHTMMLAPDAEGLWRPVPAKPGTETSPGLIVYRFGADLFFANDKRFSDEIRSLIKLAPTPVRHFVIDAGIITDLDYSAARSLRELSTELATQGVQLIFARANDYLQADMERHGISAVVGQKNIYPTLHDALAAANVTSIITRKVIAKDLTNK